jgi:CDP-glycerol glycerophosphotransferase
MLLSWQKVIIYGEDIMQKKLAYIIKHYAWIQFLYSRLMSAVFRFWGLFLKTDDKLVLFSSMSGDLYTGSPKILFEKMKEDTRFNGYRYVWAFRKIGEFETPGAKQVRIESVNYFKIALKSKVWITDVNIERGLHFKKKNTVYLNTWHGTGPKKGGNAVNGRKDYDFSNVDLFCCDGKYTHDVFIKWFNAKEESMLWCGRPREDRLLEYTENDRVIIRAKLNVPHNKKMILYMPTWREYSNENLDYIKWEKTLGKDYSLYVRLHHFAMDNADRNLCDNTFLKDVTLYPDVNELYLAADILISDYSSAFFDYGLLGKPMICYAYDYEQYKNTYGLFMDLESEFPSGVIRDEDNVIEKIIHMDYEDECKKSAQYCYKYVTHPENATNRCLDEIYKKLETVEDIK